MRSALSLLMSGEGCPLCCTWLPSKTSVTEERRPKRWGHPKNSFWQQGGGGAEQNAGSTLDSCRHQPAEVTRSQAASSRSLGWAAAAWGHETSVGLSCPRVTNFAALGWNTPLLPREPELMQTVQITRFRGAGFHFLGFPSFILTQSEK